MYSQNPTFLILSRTELWEKGEGGKESFARCPFIYFFDFIEREKEREGKTELFFF